MPARGLLLVNLGTPDAPRPREVRRYLREFLSDPRVVDISPLARFLFLNLLVLPFRPRRSNQRLLARCTARRAMRCPSSSLACAVSCERKVRSK